MLWKETDITNYAKVSLNFNSGKTIQRTANSSSLHRKEDGVECNAQNCGNNGAVEVLEVLDPPWFTIKSL